MRISIGRRVRVVGQADETLDRSWLGAVGFVAMLETRGLCGDSPEDPMYIVQFRRGRRDGFWREELEVLT